MVAEAGVANLEKVDHIVVLMLENRSFDHMLGYLSLEAARGDVDGLRGEFANEHDGRSYPILQIGDGAMNGFVTSFAGTLSRRGVQEGDPARVMGYYNAADVPVYDHLAREFAVCDRWFSSVPGATWPNRLYAICGRAAGSRDDLPHNRPPLYSQPSFMRHLDAHSITWRWYSFEAGTLRFADAHYTLGHHDRFAFFSTTNLNWKTGLEVRINPQAASFLEDAARGTLPSVAWIDPNFSPTTTTHRRTSRTAKNSCSPSTTCWPPARSGRKRCWSSSMTSTAASSITSRRPARPTTTRRCSDATAYGYRR